MYRKMERKIADWLQNSTKAFLLTGARQTGKTWLIRHVLKASEYSYYEINFIESPEMLRTFGQEVSQEDFMFRLQALLPADCEPGKTVIFFDEVQQNPELVTRIKFLVDEGSYRYILSGSLLGVTLKNLTSAPVGYLTTEKMYPMDFEEFMIANGISHTILESLEESFARRKPVDDFIHEKLISLYYIYLIVGGMPEAVRIFTEKKDIRLTGQVHRDIYEQYKADFTKYEQEDRKLKLISVYDLIPSELNKQNKRFIFTYLNKELKFDRYENSFLWLKDAGVALPVYNAEVPRIPLISGKSSNLFKLFGSDVGMLTSSYSERVRMEILQHEPDINNGALFENAVAQQLTANGLEPYFYKKSKIGEVDFLVELDGEVVPIEVKSGRQPWKHNALDCLLRVKEYTFSTVYVLCVQNFHVEAGITYLPVYMSYLLKNHEMKNTIINLDLAGLTER